MVYAAFVATKVTVTSEDVVSFSSVAKNISVFFLPYSLTYSKALFITLISVLPLILTMILVVKEPDAMGGIMLSLCF